MKKHLLFLSFITFTFVGFSQSLTIDTGGVDINGAVIDYIYSDTTAAGNYRGDAYIEITNTATNPADSIEFQVRRTPGTIDCGAYYFPTGHTMCLGELCYTGDVIPSVSNTKRLHAGETIELHVQIEFDQTGETNEFYEIYEYGNETNNLVSFNAHYKSSVDCPSSVGSLTNDISVKPYPNPANNIINFNYKVNANNSYVTIHDITGNKVGTIILSSNKNVSSFNTEQLHAGLYFYNIYIDGVKTKTDKFIVKH